MMPFAQGDNQTNVPTGETRPGTLAGIVEVMECQVREANAYLEHGYFLISIQPVTSPDRMPVTGEEFIRHSLTYVVGRIRGVARYDPPPVPLPRPMTPQMYKPPTTAGGV